MREREGGGKGRRERRERVRILSFSGYDVINDSS